MSCDRRSKRRADRDAGSGTLWVVVAIALVGFALSVALALGGLATAARHAAWAADAAALAGAADTLDGPAGACARAAVLAHLNNARLTSCELSDATVTVSVSVRLPAALAGLGSAAGRARAGPAGIGVNPIGPNE